METNVVQNAETSEVTETAEAVERRAAVSSDAFGDFLKSLSNEQYSIPEAAERIGMSVGSFRTRLSVFRTAMREAGLNVPTFKDGRLGRKGVKRVEKSALQKTIEKMVAENK